MFKNVFWDVFARFGGQLIAFVVSIVLTRLVTPEEYGVMGMALAISGVAGIFLDAGFRNALIQRQAVSGREYSSVFYLNISIAFVLAVVCYLSADLFALFLKHPDTRPICQLLSLNFILSGVNVVPGAILYKKLAFKVNAVITLIAAIGSGAAGILLAVNGFGVWSLIWQLLVNSAIVTTITWLYVGWRPLLHFSFSDIKPLWGYGSRLFTASLLEVVFTRADVFFIGRMFSPAMLGFYSRAQGMDNFVRQFSAGSLMNVLFPYIAKKQDDKEELASLFVQFIHIIMFVSVGLSFSLYLIARPLFALLFTERWDFAAQIFQIFALAGFAWPASSLMCAFLSATGNSKAFLRAEVYKKAVFLIIYGVGFWLGMFPFIWSMMVGYYLAVIINAGFVAAEIGVTLLRQLTIIAKYLITGLVGLCCCVGVGKLITMHGPWMSIAVPLTLFGLIYYALAVLLKLRGVAFVHLVRQKFKKK